MYLGFAVATLSLTYAVVVIYKTIIYGNNVRGYPSLMVTILFLGGVQLLSIGVLGEYLGRTFNEAKRRPLYFVGELLRREVHADGSVNEDPQPAVGEPQAVDSTAAIVARQ
jgi:hypothetical protein